MAAPSKRKRVLRLVVGAGLFYLGLVGVVYLFQRSLLYFPRHGEPASVLEPWVVGERVIGFRREVAEPETVWLMLHGNAGQAAERDYALQRMSDRDSLYVLEYPGYGKREGSPSRQAINQAAAEAYRLLRQQHPDRPVCVVGESLGSGPACCLAQEEKPPDKIVLMVPFDRLASVAANRFFFLPVRLLFWDAWDNVESLEQYCGPVEIYAATKDLVIPYEHAQALAEQISGARIILMDCHHNEWARCAHVKIRR